MTLSEGRLHICHLSAKESLDAVRDGRKQGKNITCEVTPHHLLLSIETELKPQSFGKTNPPLRTTRDRIELWKAFCNGEIDILASDHAPHTRDEKKEFSHSQSGMPGVETMLPLMFVQVRKNNLKLERLVNAMAEKPADMLGVTRKGRISVGNDADLIVVDMRRLSQIKGEKLHSKCGWTAFENYDAVFPRMTFVRGEPVIEDWELVGSPGFGSFIGDG